MSLFLTYYSIHIPVLLNKNCVIVEVTVIFNNAISSAEMNTTIPSKCKVHIGTREFGGYLLFSLGNLSFCLHLKLKIYYKNHFL